MLLQFVLAFLVLVAASYVGTTMALRGFFGREYHRPTANARDDGRASGRSSSPARGGPSGTSSDEPTE